MRRRTEEARLTTDPLVPAFFSGICLFVVYIARDFDTKLSRFPKEKLEIYKAIRERRKGQAVYSALGDIIEIVYTRHLKEFEGTSEELSDKIVSILHNARSWRDASEALEKIERAMYQLLNTDGIWNGYQATGIYVRNCLYAVALLCLASIPVYLLASLEVWMAWGVCAASLSIAVILFYRRFSYLGKEFGELENEFYIRA